MACPCSFSFKDLLHYSQWLRRSRRAAGSHANFTKSIGSVQRINECFDIFRYDIFAASFVVLRLLLGNCTCLSVNLFSCCGVGCIFIFAHVCPSGPCAGNCYKQADSIGRRQGQGDFARHLEVRQSNVGEDHQSHRSNQAHFLSSLAPHSVTNRFVHYDSPQTSPPRSKSCQHQQSPPQYSWDRSSSNGPTARLESSAAPARPSTSALHLPQGRRRSVTSLADLHSPPSIATAGYSRWEVRKGSAPPEIMSQQPRYDRKTSRRRGREASAGAGWGRPQEARGERLTSTGSVERERGRRESRRESKGNMHSGRSLSPTREVPKGTEKVFRTWHGPN